MIDYTAVFIFLLLSLSLIISCSFYVYLIAFRADHKKIEEDIVFPGESEIKIEKERICRLVREIYNTPHEEVSIISYDGLKLYGRYYHYADGAPIDIQFHGYRSAAARDCCGTFRISRDMGHNILLVDQRAHGKSGGKVITFGIRERYDCQAWAEYAAKRFGEKQKIMLIGLSMGAATVVMASSLNLPEGVVGIIADSTYTSPRNILLKVGRDRKIPAAFTDYFALFGAFIFGRFNIDESTAVTEAGKCKKPLLLIHGENDFFVPGKMSREVYASCPCEKHLTMLSNGGHCAGYIFNTEKYIKAISDFSRKLFKE